MTSYDTLCHTQVLLLGSGGLSIGQAGEFDYSGSQVVIVHCGTRAACGMCGMCGMCDMCGVCVACVTCGLCGACVTLVALV